jgi:glycosyltransferase involved in cell wall biosynthesis
VRARFAVRSLPRWAALARGRAAEGGPRLYYGREIPSRDDFAYGGAVKFQALEKTWPGSPLDFNVLYLGSSTVPEDVHVLIRLARRRGATVVWNQNGVAYPAWHGDGWEQTNQPLTHGLLAADHVIFQSAFCKVSSDRFLGEREDPWEVLHNPVDTAHFTPAEAPPERPTFLLGGNRSQPYRFEVALRTLALLPDDWRLLVAGPAPTRAEAEVAELGLEGRVELAGPYSQSDAPALLRRAHLLLHPKYNDPCPTLVLEAMACGLPVVYSQSGGTPELIGPAGIGVPAPLDWERDHPPAPEDLRDAVLAAAAKREELGNAARRRAVERFDLQPWLARHRELFGELRG